MASVGEKVFCPYCGAKMQRIIGLSYEDNDEPAWHWYRCSNQECESTSPAKRTVEEAHKAAVKRYEEPNRILLVDEMFSAKHCFVEWKGEFSAEECMAAIVVSDINPDTWEEGKKLKLYMADGLVYNCSLCSYGVTLRCWKKNPTSDDYDNVEWLPEKEQEDDDE